jgi:hypothetical protein
VSVWLFTSAKGSPGVTTSVMAIAWAWPTAGEGRRVLVVDADMAGSGIIPGYLRAGIRNEGGLLAVAQVRSVDLAQSLVDASSPLDEDENCLLLQGITDPTQVPALHGVWPALLQGCADLHDQGMDVLIDAGRIDTGPDWASLVAQVQGSVVVVVRSTLVSIAAATPSIRGIGPHRAPMVLVVGSGNPYSCVEIRDALGVDMVSELSWDPRTAGVFSDGEPAGWGFARSRLMRSAHDTACRLQSVAAPAEPAGQVADRDSHGPLGHRVWS